MASSYMKSELPGLSDDDNDSDNAPPASQAKEMQVGEVAPPDFESDHEDRAHFMQGQAGQTTRLFALPHPIQCRLFAFLYSSCSSP